jgi:hypothetical protein
MKSSVLLAAGALTAAIGFSMVSPQVWGRGGRGGGMGGFVRPPSTQQQNNQRNGGGVTETVTKDQLTSAESDGLKAQEDADQKASDALPGDATLTKDECDALQASFDSASFYIWSSGTDDDGKATTRYGTSIFPVEALTKMIEANTITRPQARILLAALRTLAAAKLRLSSEDMTPVDRATLQKQFNQGLAKYYAAK